MKPGPFHASLARAPAMMKILTSLIGLGAQALECVGLLLYRAGTLLHNFLPALRSPAELTAAVHGYYAGTYYSADSFTPAIVQTIGYQLEAWEADVCTRYGISRGRLLVLGCGWGREAIVIAERGATVVGLDFHPGVLSFASRAAAERNVPVRFLRGDFLSLPCKAASFDFILLSGTMYSAIPGRVARKAWLRQLRHLVTPRGLVLLSFQTAQGRTGCLDRLTARLKRVLAELPGANASYQEGDVCRGGHFFHLFREEVEVKHEFQEAGAVVRELSWPHQYAVLSYE